MAIVGILILGLILRLVNLNQSLWLDEAVQAITSQGSFAGIFTELRGDFHPPLYHILMWFWVHLFGSSEIILRLPSVIFSLATIYVVYLVAKGLFTPEVEGAPMRASAIGGDTSGVGFPLVTALFLATAPFHIYYSQEARMYAMAAFFASLSMYYFIRVFSTSEVSLAAKSGNSSTSEVSLYIFSTTLLLYSDYFGLFILLAQASFLLWRKEYHLYLYIFISLLLFLPWLPMFLTQIQVGRQATQALPGWGRLVNVNFLKALPLTFVKFSIGRITIFNKKLYAAVAGVLFIIYGSTIVKGFLKGKKLLRDFRRIRHPEFSSGSSKIPKQVRNDIRCATPTLIILWLFIPIFSAWLLSFFIPNYQPFRLLLVLPAFYLLLAYGLSKISASMIHIIGVLVIVSINLISLGVYYTIPYFHREDWRGVVKYIESHGVENSVAILPSVTSDWPWRYYSSGRVELIGVSPGVRSVEKRDLTSHQPLTTNHQIFYIRYLVPLFDSQEKISSWLAENGFVKMKEVSFNQIPLWQYQRCR